MRTLTSLSSTSRGSTWQQPRNSQQQTKRNEPANSSSTEALTPDFRAQLYELFTPIYRQINIDFA